MTQDLSMIPGLLTVETVPNLFLAEVKAIPDEDSQHPIISYFYVSDCEGIVEAKIEDSFLNKPTHLRHRTKYHQRGIDEAFHFPFIVDKETGLPFLLACNFLYDQYQLIKPTKEIPSTNTIRSHAYHLVHMLNFFFTNKEEINYLNFKFPIESQRPAYKYWQFLRKEIRAGKLSTENARLHQSTSAHFFKYIQEKGLIDAKAVLWSEDKLSIHFDSSLRGTVTKQIVRPTQYIKRRKVENHLSDFIIDGEPLRPLNDDEQKILIKAIKNIAQPWFKYLSIACLSTGMRLGTAGTLREKHINDLKKQADAGTITPFIEAGTARSLIQTKADKPLKIYFPRFVINYLYEYLHSKSRKKNLLKAEKKGLSFEKKDNQHLFINQQGNHVYWSKFDIDLLEKWIPPSSSPSSLVDHFVNNELKPEMHKLSYVGDYRFHYTRATFAMNYLKINYKSHMTGKELNLLLDDLKNLMGHTSITTTQGYINYYNNNIINSPITIANEEFVHDLLDGD